MLMSAETDASKFIVQFSNPKLHLAKTVLPDECHRALTELLVSTPANYYMTVPRCMRVHLPQGKLEYEEKDLLRDLAHCPSEMILFFIKNSSVYRPSYAENPLALQHNDLKSMSVHLGDRNIGLFERADLSSGKYQDLYKEYIRQFYDSDIGPPRLLDYVDYKNVLLIRLPLSNSVNAKENAMVDREKLRVQMTFNKALKDSMDLYFLFYAPGWLSISGPEDDRRVDVAFL